MKRKDEEFCREVFSRHLQREGGLNKLKWREVPKSAEPPDYVLEIARQRFAVEITGIMDVAEVGGCSYPSEAINIALVRFCEQLEQDAKAAGMLNGLHVVSLEPLANLKARTAEIRRRAFDYMRRTKAVKVAPPSILAQDGLRRIEIQKWGDHKDYLAPVILQGGTWEGEIRSAVRRMLQEALDEKRWKLRAIQLPRILLLLDRYHCADPGDWIEAAQEATFDGFHTVARIWQDESALVLHSDNEDWLLGVT